MTQLRARDAESLLTFLADAQSVEGREAFTTELLDRAASVMGSGFATYTEFHPRTAKAHAYVPCTSERSHPAYPRDGWGDPPRSITRLAELGMWSDDVTRSASLQTETPWWREFEIIACLWRIFRLSPSNSASLSFYRHDRDFTGRELRMLIELSPHVAALIRNSWSRRRLADLIEAVDSNERERRGFILLGRGNGIEHASPAGLRLVREWFGSSGDRLPPLLEDWLGTASVDEPLRIDGDGKRLVAEAPTRSALILTEEPAALAALTAREVDVLRAVAAGKSTKEIAKDLWVTPATVSKHLENIYRKLGVTSRTAALAAVGIARGTAASRSSARVRRRGAAACAQGGR